MKTKDTKWEYKLETKDKGEGGGTISQPKQTKVTEYKKKHKYPKAKMNKLGLNP